MISGTICGFSSLKACAAWAGFSASAAEPHRGDATQIDANRVRPQDSSLLDRQAFSLWASNKIPLAKRCAPLLCGELLGNDGGAGPLPRIPGSGLEAYPAGASGPSEAGALRGHPSDPFRPSWQPSPDSRGSVTLKMCRVTHYAKTVALSATPFRKTRPVTRSAKIPPKAGTSST